MEIHGLGAANFYQSPPKTQPQPKNDADEVTIASTDRVDAELERLRNKKSQLEQKISSNDSPNADLQRQLAQIEDELRQKDNDTYRREHTDFSTGVDISI